MRVSFKKNEKSQVLFPEIEGRIAVESTPRTWRLETCCSHTRFRFGDQVFSIRKSYLEMRLKAVFWLETMIKFGKMRENCIRMK